MSNYVENVEKLTLPIVALHGVVAFPSETINIEVRHDYFGSDLAARESAPEASLVILVPERVISEAEPSVHEEDKLYSIGVVARIKQYIKTGDGAARIIAECSSRAIINNYHKIGDYFSADVICKTVAMREDGGLRGYAYIREIVQAVSSLTRFLPSPSHELFENMRAIRNPAHLADFVASNILVRYEDKLDILRIFEPIKRIEMLLEILNDESQVLAFEAEIQAKTRSAISKGQRDYFLREEMKVIQDELGDGASDPDEYYKKIIDAKLPEEVEKKLLRENKKLAKTPFGSAEGTVISNYLDTCLSLPWSKSSADRSDVAAARKILDRDHYGLEKVKERLLEFIAVKQLAPDLKSQIICLVGPPGVGKTSIVSSLATAMKRKYVRVSLGGVRDEADIRGHRKTYIGAMPGRIIEAIDRAGVNNPLILLDEIDKMSSDGRGDPASALLEVLDPEQNKFFRDHFVELPFDLSSCMFIATANTLDTVPRPLIDRMEIIELNTYTKTEKLNIAKDHLIPKQLKRHGLNRRMLKITDSAVIELIDCYTRESGVRNLEREISALCRKAALKFIDSDIKQVKIDKKNIADHLGPRKILPELVSPEDEVGSVNGLAYTQAGGDLLKIEVAVLDGTGKLELTGNLGDVMKESAKTALTCARQLAAEYDIPSDFYQKKDIHIHVPEGAVPKDGPSAGVTMLTAVVSALSGIPVRSDVAMTGEITLRGKVLPIGGLREKTMAAYSAGVSTVLIPAENEKDLHETDALVRENLNFVFCKNASDVLASALRR